MGGVGGAACEAHLSRIGKKAGTRRRARADSDRMASIDGRALSLHRLAPGAGKPVRDANALAEVAQALLTACRANREADELCLLQFAFEQSESSKPNSS